MRSTPRSRAGSLALLLVFASACDGSPPPVDDAGQDADAGPPVPCSDDGDCGFGLICEGWPMRGFICQTPCDPSTTWICADGSVCQAVFGRPVCFGGVTTMGDACFSRYCPKGETCVGTDPDTFCAPACVPSDGSRCEAPRSCVSSGDDRGHCG